MKKIWFLIAAILLMGNAFAQTDPEKLYTDAEKYYDAENYAAAKPLLEEYIRIKEASAGYQDVTIDAQIAQAYIKLAMCQYSFMEYRQSVESYDKMIKRINYFATEEIAKTFFNWIDLCFTAMEKADSVYYTFDENDYRNTFIFRINQVFVTTDTGYWVKVNAGLNEGLFKGQKGWAISAPVPDTVFQRSYELGEAEVINIYPWESYVFIAGKPGDPLYEIKPGDMIEFKVLSKISDKSTIYQLLADDVYLQDNNSSPMLNYRYILHYDSKELQTLMLLYMANQVKETEEFTREGDIFLNPFPKGQNQGKNVHELFDTPDTSDIHDFLKFVAAFPRKYMSKDYKLNETYATWLINFSPSTPKIILDSLVNAPNDKRVIEIFEFNRDDISNKVADDWFTEAKNLADRQDYEKAGRVNYVSIKVAELLADNKMLADGLYNRAELLNKQSLYEESNMFYDSAGRRYIVLGDTVKLIKSIYYQANNFRDMGSYKQATVYYDSAYAKITKRRFKNYSQWELQAFILWDKGFMLSQKGDYSKSLAAYKISEHILDSIQASEGTRANIYKNIAYVYKQQGKYDEALKKYKQAKDMFYAVANETKVADCYDYIADTYFKMGQYRIAIENYEKAYDIKEKLYDKAGAGFSLSNVGQALWNLGSLDSAIQFHEEAIALRRAGNDSNGVAFSYQQIGDLMKENGNPLRAGDYYSKALEIYEAANDTGNMAATYDKFGELYYSFGHYELANTYFEKSAKIYEKLGNDGSLAYSTYYIGAGYYYLKSFGKAHEFLNKGFAMYEKLKDDVNKANVLVLQAFLASEADNDNAGSVAKMREALRLGKITGNNSTVGYVYNQLGWLTSSHGENETAKKYYDSSIRAYNQTENYTSKCYTQLNIGYYYITKGQFARARRQYQEVLETGRKYKNNRLMSEAYTYLSDYYNLIADYDSAKDASIKSLTINKALNNMFTEAGCYIGLGNTYNYLADYKTAVNYYRKADSIYKYVKSEISRATPKNNVGTIYFYQGDYKNALKQFYEVYDTLKAINYDGDFLETAILNIGEVYLEDGVLPEAETWLKMALDLSKKNGNMRHNGNAGLLLGKVKLKQKKYAEAKGYLFTAYKQYQKIGEKERQIEVNSFIGKLYYETNKTDSARVYLNNAIAISDQTGNTKYLWEPLYISSKIYAAKKDSAKAVADLKRAVDIIENIKGKIAGTAGLSKFAKAGDKIAIYQSLVTLLLQQNDVNAAFYYQEKANIRGLAEQVRGGEGDERGNELLDDGSSQSAARELELKVEGIYGQLVKEKSKPKEKQNPELIKKLEEMMSVNEDNYQGFVDSMVQSGEDGKQNLTYNIDPRALDKARNNLGDDEVVVEYAANADNLLIFVASNDNITARIVNIKESSLDSAVSAFYNQITQRADIAVVQKNSEKLYSLFIEPIVSLIQNKKKLAFVTFGRLFKMPFQALGHTQAGKIKYLVEEFDIVYINDLSDLANQRTGGNAEYNILAFGNCDKSLIDAETEVENIKSLYPHTTVFVRDSATEDKAKDMINSYDIIVFATHGNLDPKNFLSSYLTMAPNPAKDQDGKLTMGEVNKTRIKSVKLVVLSACNTAVNDDKTEGWINNPAKTFITKGARSAMASLWKVHSLATEELMSEYWAKLRGGESFSSSLKKAQVKLVQSDNFSHPYYWAAFELIGNW